MKKWEKERDDLILDCIDGKPSSATKLKSFIAKTIESELLRCIGKDIKEDKIMFDESEDFRIGYNQRAKDTIRRMNDN